MINNLVSVTIIYVKLLHHFKDIINFFLEDNRNLNVDIESTNDERNVALLEQAENSDDMFVEGDNGILVFICDNFIHLQHILKWRAIIRGSCMQSRI